MTFRITMMAEFESQAQAEDLMAQVKARMTNTRVVGGESPHTSYARLDDTETGVLLEMQYVDMFGIVRTGEWIAYDVAPEWIAPTGAHDAYPVLDQLGHPVRVMHNATLWENTSGSLNSWEPGVFGWSEVAQ